ncbi:hypothetical protein QBC42DRAFT_249105 [Cladorrhinum samala]|uniref:Uncharacterized protein n=1 Tax=Cladorrhinum samala TaxID=585594 RepID=A0AAV9HXG2_9PEZI|nr:hypothetical protein QBC42DRAFT_249105 [Cladorrhinum samala]
MQVAMGFADMAQHRSSSTLFTSGSTAYLLYLLLCTSIGRRKVNWVIRQVILLMATAAIISHEIDGFVFVTDLCAAWSLSRQQEVYILTDFIDTSEGETIEKGLDTHLGGIFFASQKTRKGTELNPEAQANRTEGKSPSRLFSKRSNLSWFSTKRFALESRVRY